MLASLDVLSAARFVPGRFVLCATILRLARSPRQGPAAKERGPSERNVRREMHVARRHVTEAERSRLPRIDPASDWTVSDWRIAPAERGEGHHDDFIADLLRRDGKRATRVAVTSYDLDGRTDEMLVAWVRGKVREAIADAERVAA